VATAIHINQTNQALQLQTIVNLDSKRWNHLGVASQVIKQQGS